MSAAEAISTDTVDINELRLDGGTQSRASLSESTIADYAEIYKEKTLPPIVVFYDGTSYWLADGFHRVHGARRAERTLLPAEIHQGSQRDAILYSVGANSAHGLQRTNADKRRAVELLLRDEEWSKRSDRWIAERCGVHHTFVGKNRALATDTNAPDTRTTKDGREYPAQRKAPAQVSEPEPGKYPSNDEPRQKEPDGPTVDAAEPDPVKETPRPRPEMWWTCGRCEVEFNRESATSRGWVKRGHCDDCVAPEASSVPAPSVARLRQIQDARDADPGLKTWVSIQKNLQKMVPSAEMRAAIFVVQGGDLALLRLGLSWHCSLADLKKAFREAAKHAHPDRGGTAEAFRDVQSARDLVAAWLGEDA